MISGSALTFTASTWVAGDSHPSRPASLTGKAKGFAIQRVVDYLVEIEDADRIDPGLATDGVADDDVPFL